MNQKNSYLKWVNIGINTWVTKIPSGWIIKSIDTKNEIVEDEPQPPENQRVNAFGVELPYDNKENTISEDTSTNNRVPIAVSNSMVVINDFSHKWNFKTFRWLNISRDTWKAKVAGGWVVKCVDMKNLNYLDFDQIDISSAMVFVPDPTHTWDLDA